MKIISSCLVSMAVLFCNTGKASAGEVPADLAKYSYPIFVVEGNQQHTGTAFLYQSGDTSFLVSNYHAIKGMSPLRQEIIFQSDTLYIKFPIKNAVDPVVLAVNISEEVIGETEIFSMIHRVDLLKIPITLPDNAEVNYINGLIDPAYFNAVPEHLLVFGYPAKPGSIPAFYSIQQKLSGQYNATGFAEYNSSILRQYPESSDSALALMNGTARYYYFIKPYASQGYSGSPVFGAFRDKAGKLIYRFSGVIFAGQPLTKQTWAIRGDVAYRYLTNAL